jgi:hypothetical protein
MLRTEIIIAARYDSGAGHAAATSWA